MEHPKGICVPTHQSTYHAFLNCLAALLERAVLVGSVKYCCMAFDLFTVGGEIKTMCLIYMYTGLEEHNIGRYL